MVTVDDLLQHPFLKRSEADQIQIVSVGKPRPLLESPYFPIKVETEFVFDAAVYDQEPWLTGCEERQALFCWPCLLFLKEIGPWNTIGFSKFTFLQEGLARHKYSKSHAETMLMYKIFKCRHFPSVSKPGNFELKHLVARDREIAKRIVDAMCMVVRQLHTPSKETTNTIQLKVKDCVDIVSFIKNYESHDVSGDSIHLLETSPKVLTDIVSAIADVLKEGIKTELQQSKYVSVILNEHSDVATKSQISTVFRYLKDGKVCERFAGFTNVSQYKTSQIIYDLITRVVQDYNIAERFVSYSLDGAVLASSYHMNNLRQKLLDDYPLSYFVPCYFQGLDLLLEQSLLHIKECKQFFKNLHLIKSFFYGNTKACSALGLFPGVSIDELDRNEWTNSSFLRFLKTHRREFIKFFKSVVNDHENWEMKDIPKALGYIHILREFGMVFHLVTFSKIFNSTCTLQHVLSSPMFEAAIGSDMPNEIKNTLETEKGEAAFEIFWMEVVAEMLQDQEQDHKSSSLKDATEPDTKLMYREFYLKVIDGVIQEIDNRFGSLKELQFFNLLNYSTHGKFVCDQGPLQSLLSVHGPYFDPLRLINEMKVLDTNCTIFAQKSLYELMDIFVSRNLKEPFKNLFQLAELTLTMPCKPPSADTRPSKLNKIIAWSSISDNKDRENDLRLLCIENMYLEELRNKPDFLKDVFFKFQDVNSSLKLV